MYTLKDLNNEIEKIALEYDLVPQCCVFEAFLNFEICKNALQTDIEDMQKCINFRKVEHQVIERENEFNLYCPSYDSETLQSYLKKYLDPQCETTEVYYYSHLRKVPVDIKKFRDHFIPKFKIFLEDLKRLHDPALETFKNQSKSDPKILRREFKRAHFLNNEYGAIMQECDQFLKKYELSLMSSHVFACFLYQAADLPIPAELLSRRKPSSNVLNFSFREIGNNSGYSTEHLTIDTTGHPILKSKLASLYFETNAMSQYCHINSTNLKVLMAKFHAYIKDLATCNYSSVYYKLKAVSKDDAEINDIKQDTKSNMVLFSPCKEREKPIIENKEAKQPRRSTRSAVKR